MGMVCYFPLISPQISLVLIQDSAGNSICGVVSVLFSALADVSDIKRQVPLLETADELCAVARDLNADPGEMRLGTRATEAEVKRLSAEGTLAQYRIVHFATHGLLAGQLKCQKSGEAAMGGLPPSAGPFSA
jgi:CHAT domain-containing protein